MAFLVDRLRACFARKVSALEIGPDWRSGKDFNLLNDLDVDHVLWPVMITLCTISAAVSVVNTVVLTRKSMISCTLNVLLVALEISNIVLAVASCIQATIQILYGHFVPIMRVLILNVLLSELVFVVALFINWLTVLIGSWRLIAVQWPLKSASILTRKKATTITILILCFSTFPLGMRGPQYKIENSNVTICSDINGMDLTSYNYYWVTFQPWVLAYGRTIANLAILVNVVYFLLPCVCFLAITGGLLWTIYKNNLRKRTLHEGQGGTNAEKGQTRTTLILIVMLSMFLASNTVPVIIRLIYFSPYDTRLLYKLVRIFNPFPLSLLTNSTSFVAYYFMGTNFRNNFHMLFKISSKTKQTSFSSVQTIESDIV